MIIDNDQRDKICHNNRNKRAGAKLGQAQVKLDDIVEVVVNVVVIAVVQVEV